MSIEGGESLFCVALHSHILWGISEMMAPKGAPFFFFPFLPSFLSSYMHPCFACMYACVGMLEPLELQAVLSFHMGARN